MNDLIAINVAIFSILLSLVALELGAALFYLIDYDRYADKISRYISISWEISGTFLVFYLVDFAATYPDLIATIGKLYIGLILVAGALIIIRNAFIAYSEYSENILDKKRYARIYSIATISAGFLFITVFTSIVSGIGVNVSNISIDFIRVLANLYNIDIFLGIVAISLVAGMIFFDIRSFKTLALLSVISAISFLASIFASPAGLESLPSLLLNRIYLIIPLVMIFIVVLFLYLKRNKIARPLVFPFLFLLSIMIGLEGYPALFGNRISLQSYLPPTSSGFYVLVVTIGGGISLVLAIYALLYAHSLSKK